MKEINSFFRKNNYCGVFLVFSLIMSFMMMNNTFAASTLTLTSSGSQDINVGASAGSAISADSINVATNCRYGYNLTLSTSVNDNNLYLNGDSSNNTTGTYFSPVDGTSALNATTNMWGYYYNASTAPTNTSVFSPVPTLANPATVKTPLTTSSSSDINDNFNIYYGVSSSPTMAKGTYKMIPDTNNSNNDGTLVYTATIADNCTRYTVHFSPTSIFEGNTLSGTGTMNDQSIYEGVATPLTANSFTAPSGYYFAGWNTAQDGSGTQYTNSQSVTDIASTGSTITLYAQWTGCPPNKICYYSNASSGVEGTMGKQNVSSGSTPMLLASNYSRSGYGFGGWNTKYDYTGTNYGPNQTIPAPDDIDTKGLSLYAIWVESAGNLQNWTGCSSMSIGDITALKDARDDDVYAVAKLADGKCWMIENMRLDNTNSDNSTGALAQGYGTSATYGNFSGLANPESGNFENSSTANSLYYSGTQSGTASININTIDYPGARFPRYNNRNTSSRANNPTTNSDKKMYSFGNYYTWAAAIADTTYYNTHNQSVTNTSICPKGWRLPKGGDKTRIESNDDNEFWNLVVDKLYNGVLPVNYSSSVEPYYSTPEESAPVSAILRSYPNNFVYSGNMDRDYARSVGEHGAYWTSTKDTSSTYSFGEAYRMYLGYYVVQPGTMSTAPIAGLSIRCVAGT